MYWVHSSPIHSLKGAPDMKASKILPINEMPPLTLAGDESDCPRDIRIQIKRMVQIARWENTYLVKTLNHLDSESCDLSQKIESIRNVRNQFMDLARRLKNNAIREKVSH